MEKIKNIPSLRFNDYKGEWESKTLKEICEKIQDGNYGADYPKSSEFFQKGIPFLTSKTIGQDGTILEEKIDYISIVKHNQLKKAHLKLNDILFTNRGSNVGSVGLVNERIANGNIGPQITLLRCNNKIYYLFLKEIMSSNIIQKQVKSQNSGSAMNFFGIGETSKFRIPITSIEEQTKIATFLTTVDEKLQALKQKKTLLNQYKKGVMNKIFSQEIRFKDDDGNNYQDWEKKKLGAVANKKSSNISANKIEDNFGDYIIYGASGILKKVDFYKEEDDYISIIKDGAGVGRLLYCKGQSSVLGTMEIIRPNEQIDTYYLFCLLSNIDFVKYVTGSTIPHIYFKDYSSEICGIPCLEEQTKIANFLSAIDEKIKYCQEQIVNTEVWKKGLLQQMFC
jgi:type I restriction enzyme S subunit